MLPGMATATVAPESAGTRDRAGRAWQVARWLTLLLYAVTALTVVVVGARAEPYDELQSALQRGAVDQVRVQGALDGPGGYSDGAQGVTTVRLEWREGWHRSVAEVWQVSSLEELRSQGHGDSGRAHIIGDVEQELARISPGVEVVPAPIQSGAVGSFAGWEMRGLGAYLPIALLVACLGVVMTSPEPRLATRWGWAWLTLSPALVLAAPAFLLLGARGQVTGQPRLSGVGAFLISVVVIGAASV